MNVCAQSRTRQGASPLGRGHLPAGSGRPGRAPQLPGTARARESAAGFASVAPTGGRSTSGPASANDRADCWKINGMHLVDWIGQVPRSGEKPRYRERFPPSFRHRSIKLRARTPAKPAPGSAGHQRRERFGEIRLEHWSGFERSGPSFRLQPTARNEPQLVPVTYRAVGR